MLISYLSVVPDLQTEPLRDPVLYNISPRLEEFREKTFKSKIIFITKQTSKQARSELDDFRNFVVITYCG